MLALILILAVTVPSTILADCCWPREMSALLYVTGEPYPLQFTIDFQKDAYMMQPIGSAEVDYVLHDQVNQEYYTKYIGGKCTIQRNVQRVHTQCIDKNIFKILRGPSKLTADKKVKTYETVRNDNFRMVMEDSSSCLPVVSADKISDCRNRMTVFTNAQSAQSTSNIDKFSELRNCIESAVSVIG